MCGRFTIATRREKVEKLIAGLKIAEWREPQYDVRPTQDVPAILNHAPLEVSWIRWGLVPPWADDLKLGSRFINARAESLSEKPTFRKSLASKRCAIVGDGFFEWQEQAGSKKKKQMHFHLPQGDPFCFAGLWDVWHSPEGREFKTCTIITTAARGVVNGIHDRMPVLLSPSHVEAWLSPDPLTDESRAVILAGGLNDALVVEPWQATQPDLELPGFS